MRGPRIFNVAGRESVVESPFNKVRWEISAFCNSVESSITCIGIFQNIALLEILRDSLLTGGGVDPQSTGCNATKDRVVTKFLKGVLNISENF